MVTIDQATRDALRATKKELHAQESHKRQLRRNAARKRALIAVAASRKEAHIAAIQARGETQANILAQREAYRASHIQDARSGQRGKTIWNAAKTVGSSVPSSDSGLIVTTMFVIAGLIVMYILVANPASTGFLGILGSGIHALSSTRPIFTVTPATDGD